MSVTKVAETSESASSQWSDAARRVGILISGIPNPVDGSGSAWGKWGLGVINPLDRQIKIYSVAVASPAAKLFEGSPSGAEPTSGWRTLQITGEQSLMLWEAGTEPLIVPAKSIKQFRVENKVSVNSVEGAIVVEALSSEGKMNVIYSVTAHALHPTMNVYYTDDPEDATNNWGYLIENVQSGRNDKIFNATVENSSSNDLESRVVLIILLPKDFKDIKDVTNGSGGWNTAEIGQNPDLSWVLTVNRTSTTFGGNTDQTYQFSVDVPTVTETELYVFQTTAVYTDWTEQDDYIQIASALSEAAVQVVLP